MSHSSRLQEFQAERILFLIDIDAEANLRDFVRMSGNTEQPTRLDMVKQALCNFVCAKKLFSSQHEFALGTLSDRVEMV